MVGQRNTGMTGTGTQTLRTNALSLEGHIGNSMAMESMGTENALRDHYRARRQTVRCLWNNIVKVGLSGRKGRPSAEILEWQSPFFDVIRLEVSLLAPDIVVFFTGPKYDEFIRRVFPDARFEAARGRTERQLARVTAAGLPRAAVRTYHPGYLWRQGRQGFEEYLKEILNLLRR